MPRPNQNRIKASKVVTYRPVLPEHTSLNVATETGSGVAATVSDYKTKHVYIAIDTISAGGRVAVKFYESGSDSQPSWNASASASNRLSPINAKKLPATADVDGDTGIIFTAGAMSPVEVYVNSDGANYLNTNITTYSTSITASITTKITAWN